MGREGGQEAQPRARGSERQWVSLTENSRFLWVGMEVSLTGECVRLSGARDPIWALRTFLQRRDTFKSHDDIEGGHPIPAAGKNMSMLVA